MYTSLISIIVPVYNVENFINECIDSIINQTYSKLEIILINDGSADKSGEICEEYAKKDQRIKVYHKKNGGLSEARNMGLDKATGSYISFIDSDDYVHPRFIEILYDNLLSQCSEISFCSITSSDFKISNEASYLDFDSFMHFKNQLEAVIMCNKLFKTNIWNSVRFEIGRFHEDEFIFHKIFYKRSFSYTASKLYFYRKREGSIMSTSNEKRRNDARKAFDERYLFFKNQNGEYTKKIIQDIIYLNLRYFNTYRDNESIAFLRRNTFNLLSLRTHNWKEKLFLIKSVWLPKKIKQ